MKKILSVIKNNKSFSYYAIFISIIIFYICAFTYSQLEDPTRNYGEDILNENIILDEIVIKKAEQVYNPDKELFVLKYKIESTNNKAVLVDETNLKVKTIMEKEYTKLNSRTFYPLNNYIIIEIKDIPKDYTALKVQFDYKKFDNDAKLISVKGEGYTVANENDIDKNLKTKSKSEYFYDAFELRKDELTKLIKEGEEYIKNSEIKIESLEKENANLNPNDLSLTKNEKETVQSTLTNNEGSIKTLEEDAKNKRIEIKELNKALSEVQKKINSL